MRGSPAGRRAADASQARPRQPSATSNVSAYSRDGEDLADEEHTEIRDRAARRARTNPARTSPPATPKGCRERKRAGARERVLCGRQRKSAARQDEGSSARAAAKKPLECRSATRTTPATSCSKPFAGTGAWRDSSLPVHREDQGSRATHHAGRPTSCPQCHPGRAMPPTRRARSSRIPIGLAVHRARPGDFDPCSKCTPSSTPRYWRHESSAGAVRPTVFSGSARRCAPLPTRIGLRFSLPARAAHSGQDHCQPGSGSLRGNKPSVPA